MQELTCPREVRTVAMKATERVQQSLCRWSADSQKYCFLKFVRSCPRFAWKRYLMKWQVWILGHSGCSDCSTSLCHIHSLWHLVLRRSLLCSFGQRDSKDRCQLLGVGHFGLSQSNIGWCLLPSCFRSLWTGNCFNLPKHPQVPNSLLGSLDSGWFE